MPFNPRDRLDGFLVNLKATHRAATFIADKTSLPMLSVATYADTVADNMTAAHAALQELQGRFTNAQIAARLADILEPAPADLAAAYVASRAAAIAMLDDYGANVLPTMGFPYTWNAGQRQHVVAQFTLPASLIANSVTLRDALAAFA